MTAAHESRAADASRRQLSNLTGQSIQVWRCDSHSAGIRYPIDLGLAIACCVDEDEDEDEALLIELAMIFVILLILRRLYMPCSMKHNTKEI